MPDITCVLDQPLLVGDLFYVTLESADFDFTPSLAVCERSQLLDGPEFETRFRCVRDLELSERDE